MAPTYTILNDIKLGIGIWLREQGFRTGDPEVSSDCGLDVYTATGSWLCCLDFYNEGMWVIETSVAGDLFRGYDAITRRRNLELATRPLLFEYADPALMEHIREYLDNLPIREPPPGIPDPLL